MKNRDSEQQNKATVAYGTILSYQTQIIRVSEAQERENEEEKIFEEIITKNFLKYGQKKH